MAEVPVAGSGFLADVKAGDQRLRLLATETGYGVAANIYSLTPSTSRCLETATTGTGRACSKGVSMAMIPSTARLSKIFGHTSIQVGPLPLADDRIKIAFLQQIVLDPAHYQRFADLRHDHANREAPWVPQRPRHKVWPVIQPFRFGKSPVLDVLRNRSRGRRPVDDQ